MLKAHNVKPPSEHVCEICLKTFSKKDHLTRHESVVHMGVRETCQYCNNQFSSLAKHIKSQHSQHLGQHTMKAEPKLYPCDECNKIFYKKSILSSHRSSVHSVESAVKKMCHICDKEYSNLTQHIEIVHNNTKKYSCQKCQKGFYDNRELRRHHIKYLKTGECQKEASDETCKYTCDFDGCQYQTNKKSNMEMHKQSVHLNIKYSCPECGKQLSSKANLNSHVKNVHDKRLIGGVLENNPFHLKFRCKLCSYNTSRALHLDRHMLSVHSAAAFETVEQVYQASTQNKQFSGQLDKPQLINPIKPHHPNAKLPQFANLVKLEKVGGHGGAEEVELMAEEEEEDPAKASVEEGDLFNEFKDVQYVSLQGGAGAGGGDGLQQDSICQVVSRRVSTESGAGVGTGHQLVISSQELPGLLETAAEQLVSQTSTFTVDSTGRLIIPEEATIVNLPGGLVLPLDTYTISPIYFASY